jgi:hypothetical protein
MGGCDLEQFPDTSRELRFRGDVGHCKLKAFPADLGPVRGFQIALGADVVGVEDVVEPGRIATTARVLQQQDVIEVRLHFRREADFLGDAHADHATTHRMAHGAAFGEIQRIGKCGKQFGDANGTAYARRLGGLGSDNLRQFGADECGHLQIPQILFRCLAVQTKLRRWMSSCQCTQIGLGPSGN